MYLHEMLLKNAVLIDFTADVICGSDVMYQKTETNESQPVRFATVTFQLKDTDILEKIAEFTRKELGFRPLYSHDCARDGWYSFFISINNFAEDRMDSCIEFILTDSEESDNDKLHTIELSKEDRAFLYDILSNQCKKNLRKSCDDLLAEADIKMREEQE